MTDIAADTAAVAAVRRLIREARFGALATLEPEGGPYASLVAIATDPEGRPTLLISRLARHTRNISRDQRMSLLVSAADAPDPLNAPRASLTGRIVPAPEAAVRTRYIARHPTAAGYADFADFAFYRMEIEGAHLVEGFGRIVDVPGAALLTGWDDAAELAEGHDGIVTHMNDDHADAVALYATVLAGATGGATSGAWRMVALDPEGFEVASAERVCRIEFSQRIASPAAARKELVALVHRARRDSAA
ncbi:HugZ family protein [Xanthobacter sp. AM11]|uniref:HugZ family pyridoxamine 5'-phosphate oxidase n=1 Tax=Xanthobacter sp. AM11 TaxID=3380643 RepID=UPI0039BEE2E1